MAYTTIDDPSAHFHIQLYTGNADANAITNDANAGDFAPDLIWMKNREISAAHGLYDSTRGTGTSKSLKSDETAVEGDASGNMNLTAFSSDGFSLGATSGTNQINYADDGHVAWQWKANGGSTTTNDASATSVGNVDSVYQTNTTARFSIVTYTGTASDDSVLAHGLGASPELIIIKARDATSGWSVNHTSTGITSGYYQLQTNVVFTSADNNVKAVSSTTFTLGVDSWVNGSGVDFIAYFFKGIQGYSKFGGYTGNAANDGPFVYTGFKPRFVLLKCSDVVESWYIWDTTRSIYNLVDDFLNPNSNNAETVNADRSIDALSNGFKLRGTNTATNGDGNTYSYAAFAHQPFVTSGGVPCTVF